MMNDKMRRREPCHREPNTKLDFSRRDDGGRMATAIEISDEPVPREWKDVLEDILPPQGAWSEEKYLVLTDHSMRFVEYTDGFVEALPMPTPEHQLLTRFLFLAFFNFFGPIGGQVLFAPLRV